MDQSQVTMDILSNPRYQGAIQSISGLTNWIDAGFGMVITFVAFLIILVALLKNVLAGAYVAFPKFWDAVNQAHLAKAALQTGWGERVQQTLTREGLMKINGGSFKNLIFGALPDIKSLTDFEGDTIRPRDYFTRAIIQMCAVIMIGAFIYNGFYRDVAGKVADFGSEMISRVILEADPIAMFDQFTSTAGRPAFSTDDSVDDYNKFINKVAVESYSTVIGTYNDIKTAEAKSALANKIETWVINSIKNDNQCVQCLQSPEWEPRVSVSLVMGEPALTSLNNISSDGLVIQRAYACPVSDFELSSTEEVGRNWYLRIIIQFQKQAANAGTVMSLTDLQLNVPSGDCVLSMSSTGYIKADNGCVAKQGSQSYKVTVDGNSNKLTIHGFTGDDTKLTVESGLYWMFGGKVHRITTIYVKSSMTAGNDLYTPTLNDHFFTIAKGPDKWDLAPAVSDTTATTQ